MSKNEGNQKLKFFKPSIWRGMPPPIFALHLGSSLGLFDYSKNKEKLLIDEIQLEDSYLRNHVFKTI